MVEGGEQTVGTWSWDPEFADIGGSERTRSSEFGDHCAGVRQYPVRFLGHVMHSLVPCSQACRYVAAGPGDQGSEVDSVCLDA